MRLSGSDSIISSLMHLSFRFIKMLCLSLKQASFCLKYFKLYNVLPFFSSTVLLLQLKFPIVLNFHSWHRLVLMFLLGSPYFGPIQ